MTDSDKRFDAVEELIEKALLAAGIEPEAGFRNNLSGKKDSPKEINKVGYSGLQSFRSPEEKTPKPVAEDLENELAEDEEENDYHSKQSLHRSSSSQFQQEKPFSFGSAGPSPSFGQRKGILKYSQRFQ